MLNLDQLQRTVASGKRQFDLIRKKYPDLKAYLVLSLPEGQTGIDSPPKEILRELPGVIVDDGAKTRALDLMSRMEKLEWQTKADPETDRLMEQLNQLAARFRYDDKCQVEIRFKDLNYELIRKLQQDDLVDRDLTPQTRASIRIVLGTISRFAGT